MFNRRISGGRFPFWGCPASAAGPFLGPTHHRGHDGEGLAEKRLIDMLDGRGAALLEARLYRLGRQPGPDRDPGRARACAMIRVGRPGPHLAVRDRVFASDEARPDEAQIVFAEIWPSWWPIPPELGRRRTRRRSAPWPPSSRRRTASGELARWLAGPPGLSAEQVRTIETEEAWTLGVMAPRRRHGPPLRAAARERSD